VGAVAKYFLVMFLFQFAKAGSAATLSQQEKKLTAGLNWGSINITGSICIEAKLSSRRCVFGEFESFATASRPGLLWQSSPGVASGLMVYLRVLARTGRRTV
jgi:hypothetical protein